tara:strand:- start:254 stop:937 length:684 start_codon:yes stop_codon:yes gene_type:complete
MNEKIIISCFDVTTEMVKIWAENGYLCYCVDIQHELGENREGNIIKVGADMNSWMPPRGNVVFASFFPPCTDVAVSGARWFKDKGLGAVINALKLFKISIDIAEYLGCPYMIENPVSTVSTYWRKPDYKFDPYEYGGYLPEDDVHPLYPNIITPRDAYSKKTCLWVGNGFQMPKKKEVELKKNYLPNGKYMSEVSQLSFGLKPELRANVRSATPRGFAKAVFEYNET